MTADTVEQMRFAALTLTGWSSEDVSRKPDVAMGAISSISESLNRWADEIEAPHVAQPPTVAREPVPQGDNHDTALDWVTSNCTAIRRDNGDMDYSLGQMIRAFEAGRDTRTSVAEAARVQLLDDISDAIGEHVDEGTFEYRLDSSKIIEDMAKSVLRALTKEGDAG